MLAICSWDLRMISAARRNVLQDSLVSVGKHSQHHSGGCPQQK